MTVLEVIAAVRSAGGTFSIAGGRLAVDAPADLPETVWQAVADNRSDILRLLSPGPTALHQAIRRAGGEVVVDGDRLAFHLPGGLDDELLVSLASERDALHQHLSRTEPADPFVSAPSRDDDLPLPAGADRCDRCRSTETVDQPIHDGQSVRRDCAACGRFRKFVTWNGVPMP